MSNDSLRLVLLGLTLATACVFDLRQRRIPNLLTGTALMLGIALLLEAHGLLGLRLLLAGIGVASIALLSYAGGMLGAGDVKLLWVVGALTGPRFMGLALLLTALSGGILGLIWAKRSKDKRLPYAIAICVGTTLAECLTRGRSDV